MKIPKTVTTKKRISDMEIAKRAQWPRHELTIVCIVDPPMCCRCGTGCYHCCICSSCAEIEHRARIEQFQLRFDTDKIVSMLEEIERLKKGKQ